MKRRNSSCKCIIAFILLAVGVIFLCLVSWKFMLFIAAAILILIGIILIRKC